MTSKLKPTAAIKEECSHCMNGARGARQQCTSVVCQLSPLVPHRSPLRRIKAHCLTCVPPQSFYGVRDCDGKILNPTPHCCPLHPYRFGHDPNRKGKGEGNLKSLMACHEARIRGPFSSLKSTNEDAHE
jgi:hypothetical protein